MMVKSVKQPIPIYSLIHDYGQFKLATLTLELNEDKTYRLKKISCSLMAVYECLKTAKKQEREQGEFRFYLSFFTLIIAEKFQRKLIERITLPNTRNIRLSTFTTNNYLWEGFVQIMMEVNFPYAQFPDMSSAYKRKLINKMIQKKMEIKELNIAEELLGSLDKAFLDVKGKLGFPENNPTEFSCKVTPEVMGAAVDENCIKYLEQKRALPYIFPQALGNIINELKGNYSSDAVKVIEKLKKTCTRDHIAAFSISTENNQIYVSMVNEQSRYVKMESWKFLHLIENIGKALRLHAFEKKRINDPNDPFEFGTNNEGYVIGKFNAQESWIDIVCLDINTEEIKDRATFIVDSTYVLCMYTMLKRLHDDKEKFMILLDKAKSALHPIEDPFELLPKPFL